MGQFATLAVKTRNNKLRWYSRITISKDLANIAKFSPGMRVNVSSNENKITVVADDCGNLMFPPLKGKRNQYFPLEVAADKLGLEHELLHETSMDFQVSKGEIQISVPKLCFTDKPRIFSKPKRKYVSVHKKRHEEALFLSQFEDGVSRTIVFEGLRSGINVRPIGINEVIAYFKNQGNHIVQLNPRHYKLNDAAINVANLSELYASIHGANDWNPIVLVMDQVA